MSNAADYFTVRLALLRARIDADFVPLILPPEEVYTDEPDAAWRATRVSRSTLTGWEGENVIVWHRSNGQALEAYAMQEACPHASISLADSDIEDLGSAYPGQLHGPCIACPAHTYVFDAGTGRCLTDDHTPAARIYEVRTTSSSSGQAVLWIAREPNTMPADAGRKQQDVGAEQGNAIQLTMVERALRRRFGDSEQHAGGGGGANGCGSAPENEYEFFQRY